MLTILSLPQCLDIGTHAERQTSQWRHNGRDDVSNHQPHHCLLNRLFRSKKTSKLRVTGLCSGNSPGTGEFPAQMASNAGNSIWFFLMTSSWLFNTSVRWFQIGSYFGTSLCAVDLNGDGYEELLVGAPLFRGHRGDEGAVFVYINRLKVSNLCALGCGFSDKTHTKTQVDTIYRYICIIWHGFSFADGSSLSHSEVRFENYLKLTQILTSKFLNDLVPWFLTSLHNLVTN